MTALPPIVLASGSRYRAAMLKRLGLPFTTATSGADESPRPQESPETLVRRLAQAKAERVVATRPEAIVIGADQVAALDRSEDPAVLGKPGNRTRAIEQLEKMSGQRVRFLSAIALIGNGASRVDIVPTELRFRRLDRDEIERYVDTDRPFDCAGAMRSESAGICLVESMTSDDPTALIGLPLIRLAGWLREAGFAVP